MPPIKVYHLADVHLGVENYGRLDPNTGLFGRLSDFLRSIDAVIDAACEEQADLVVTVCGHADEHCPVLPPGTRKVHWPLDDPAKATGTEEEILQVFRASRDDIRERVRALLKELQQQAAQQ